VTDNSKTRSLFIRIMELLDMVWGSESDGVAEIDIDVGQELESLFQSPVSDLQYVLKGTWGNLPAPRYSVGCLSLRNRWR